MVQYLLFAIAFLIAGVGVELIGFGISAILMSLLPFILPLSTAIPLVAVISLVATGIVAIKTKTHNLSPHLIPLFAGAFVGVPLGILFLGYAQEETLSLILGVVLIVYVLYNFFSKESFLKMGNVGGFIMGSIAGFFGASFNVNGPLIGLYSIANENLSKHENKDLVATYMGITGVFVVVGHLLSGRITGEVLRYVLFALPCLFLGLFLGTELFKKVSPIWIERAIYAFVFIAGVSLLFK
ncbi:MAG: sulfite exporter TauE/SafE family protein [Patescibacteria group bacterium]|nr:sulfite exporter TauE/SafE family protein [Patescibacteria group bacterium]